MFLLQGAAWSPVRALIEGDIGRLSSAFENIELLNMTVLPVAYAQV